MSLGLPHSLEAFIVERGIKVAQQGVLGIFFTQDSMVGRYAPVDTQTVIQYANAFIGFRKIEVVAFILEHGCIAQHGKSMSKTLGYKN